ncbi:3455_t:CDS:1, partial [Cetraspora pellucida]
CTLNDEFDELRLGSTINHNSNLMFWACFSWHGLGPIVPIHGNVNGEVYAKLIVNHAIPAIRHLVSDEQGIFQQDGAISHKYWKVKEVLEQAGIPVLPWLAQSPDMSPMKLMWQEVERQLHNSLDKPTNIDDLEKKVIAAWYSIPSQYYHG